jgi:hypothetical protein
LLVAAAWPALALATSSLTFEGGGYTIEMEVGDDAAPAIARMRMHVPGDARGTPLDPAKVAVQDFDPRQRILSLTHAGDPARAPAFSLRVRGTRAVLEMDGRRVEAAFDWER